MAVNIDIEESPLRPKILQIMKAVYQRYDPINEPRVIDHWSHTAMLSYQPFSFNPWKLHAATLEFIEGRPDQLEMDTRFAIDLTTDSLFDESNDKHLSTPSEVLPLLGELRQYIERKLKAERVPHESAYYLRLVEEGLLTHEDYEKYRKKELNWGGRCPICSADCGEASKLAPCAACGILSCKNRLCNGHLVDGMRNCDEGCSPSYCRKCMGDDEHAKLFTCSNCHHSNCPSHMFLLSSLDLCVGRPLPVLPLPAARNVERQQPPNQAQTRPLHAPKIAPCKDCVLSDPAWNRCSRSSCWSRPRGNMVCNACSPNGGLKCSEHITWVCDDCSHAQCPPVWKCPGCEKPYCTTCHKIDHCVACGTSRLCDDCIGPDSNEEDPTPISTHPDWTCEGCQGKICSRCVSAGKLVRCGSCQKMTCKDCSGVDRCSECGTPMCEICYWDSCRRCGSFGEKQIADGMIGVDFDEDPEYY